MGRTTPSSDFSAYVPPCCMFMLRVRVYCPLPSAVDMGEPQRRRAGISEPPDGGWGWVCVFGWALLWFIHGGILRTFSLIHEELRMRYNASASQAAWVYAFSVTTTLMSGLCQVYYVNLFYKFTIH